MRKIEIKGIGITSAFKATLYVAIIPLGLMMIIGLLITIIGILIKQTAMLALGIPYIVLPIIMIGFYGVISMLVALIYNKLSSKFGGLEIAISEKAGATQDITSNRV